MDYPVNTFCIARDFSGCLMICVGATQLPSFCLEHFLFHVLCISLEIRNQKSRLTCSRILGQ